jgi:hypothetical protein
MQGLFVAWSSVSCTSSKLVGGISGKKEKKKEKSKKDTQKEHIKQAKIVEKNTQNKTKKTH